MHLTTDICIQLASIPLTHPAIGIHTGKERRCRHGQDTGQKISGPSISTGGRRGIRAIGTDHVVDSRHVDAVVGDSHDGGEDHGPHPVDRRPQAGPGESDETEGQARGRVEEPPQPGLVLGALIVGLLAPLDNVASDDGEEGQPRDGVAHQDGDEGQAQLDGTEIPLFVDEGEGLDEHEDEGVAETAQQGQRQDDRLGDEHPERADPGDQDLLHGEALLEGDELVGAIDVGVLAALAPLLGDAVHQDGRPGLGDKQQVHNLHKRAEDELDPHVPAPVEVFLDKATDNGTQDGARNGGEDNEGHSILLVVSLPHVRDHPQRHRASSGGQATKGTADHDGAKVFPQSTGQLPDVDKEETGLEDRLAAQLLTPRGPQLAAKGVEDQEDHGTAAASLHADTKLLSHARQGIRIEASVEVHRGLDEEDDSEDGPLLPGGE
mgnify:CR=1 FL=1